MADVAKNPVLLGLDIGTTNCKLMAYAPDGTTLAEASAGYEVYHPQPEFAELDPADIMAAVNDLLRDIAPKIAGHDDISLAISAQGEAFVLVDKTGKALTSAPVSVDMRGRELIAEFTARQDVGPVCEQTGQVLNSLSSVSKLLWFKDQAPEIFDRCDKVLCVGEFVVRQLGVAPAIDHSMASRMGLLDNIGLNWSVDLCRLAGLPEKILPPTAPSGTFLGTVALETAQTLGLNHPLKIYAGGHDQVCAMLGAGVVTPGTGLYSIGTTEALALSINGYPQDIFSPAIVPYPHVIPGQYVALMGNQSGGRLLDWFRTLRGINDTDTFLRDLPDLPSRATLIPHFAGSGSMLADEQAFGILSGLGFSTTPQDLTHAVLEGITMEQALALQQIRQLGIRIDRLRAVGGGTRSAKWMQIKADIMDMPIDAMQSPDTACAGAAMLAGIGGGHLSSLDEAVSMFAKVGETFEPRKAYSEIYREKLTLYHDIYQSQKSHQAKQADLARMIDTLHTRQKDN